MLFLMLLIISSGQNPARVLPPIQRASAVVGRAMTSKSENLGDDTSKGNIPEFVDTISGKFFDYVENFYEICDEIADER